MRSNYDRREASRSWTNARHYGQEIIVRMRAPGMGVERVGSGCSAEVVKPSDTISRHGPNNCIWRTFVPKVSKRILRYARMACG